jgi:hypothetical protein
MTCPSWPLAGFTVAPAGSGAIVSRPPVNAGAGGGVAASGASASAGLTAEKRGGGVVPAQPVRKSAVSTALAALVCMSPHPS